MLFKKSKMFRKLIILILIICSMTFPVHAIDNEHNFIHYYYNQLDNIQKEIYDNLIKSQEKFLNKEEVIFSITQYDAKKESDLQKYVFSVQKARRAYIYDNPKVAIWFDNYKCTLYLSNGYVYLKCKIREPAELNTFFVSDNVKETMKIFEIKCEEIVSQLSGTDEEKLKQIHDWITRNAIYDKTLSAPNTKTAYGNIIEGRSICSGFAFAYKYLADLAGLNVIYVVGNLYYKQSNQYVLHAWNVAYVNQKYVLVDTTLDIPVNNKYKNKFLNSPLHDGMHYAEYDYFNYTF